MKPNNLLIGMGCIIFSSFTIILIVLEALEIIGPQIFIIGYADINVYLIFYVLINSGFVLIGTGFLLGFLENRENISLVFFIIPLVLFPISVRYFINLRIIDTDYKNYVNILFFLPTYQSPEFFSISDELVKLWFFKSSLEVHFMQGISYIMLIAFFVLFGSFLILKRRDMIHEKFTLTLGMITLIACGLYSVFSLLYFFSKHYWYEANILTYTAYLFETPTFDLPPQPGFIVMKSYEILEFWLRIFTFGSVLPLGIIIVLVGLNFFIETKEELKGKMKKIA